MILLRARVEDLESIVGSSGELAKLLALTHIGDWIHGATSLFLFPYISRVFCQVQQESRDFIKEENVWYAKNNSFQAQRKVK